MHNDTHASCTPPPVLVNGPGLLRLSVEQREAFLLFSVVELSLAEVADVTQAPLETAKTRLRYAREALRHRLSGWRDD